MTTYNLPKEQVPLDSYEVRAAKKVLSMIKADFGKSFAQLKKDILATVPKGCTSSDHFKSPVMVTRFFIPLILTLQVE